MLKIGEFAGLFDVSIKTVRFYEEKELFYPAYVDKYSGYRYYDEKNIEQMGRILYLKELGFSLEEIKNYDENRLQEKIQEYQARIECLKSNINILQKLPNTKKEEINFFVNDENAIGKWRLKGVASSKEEAKKQELENGKGLALQELYLMENGRKYWVVSWSKNCIYIKDRKNPYEIEGDLMYVEILYPEDDSVYMVAVYEKENNKKYTIDEIRKKDKFSGFFKEDFRVIGFWETVAFVKPGQKFSYRMVQNNEKFDLQRLTINPGDQTIVIYRKDKTPELSKYTKHYFLNLVTEDTMCNYIYQKINGKEYLKVEWKTEDYSFGKKLEGYYILEKKGGNFMEGIFEKKKKIYQILSSEKNGLLLGKDIYLPADKRGNINTMIVAGSGAGKSASFVVPNVLEKLGSYVITDFWGEIYERTHEYLEKNGYIVKTINYNDTPNNYAYNPLNHIKSDLDIEILADILIGDEQTDEFWDGSSRCFMRAILYYVMAKEEKKDLLSCFKLMSLNREQLAEKLEEFDENSVIGKNYAILKTFPPKTYQSVVSTAIMKLSFVINTIPEDRDYSDTFDFSEIANQKMAIFLTCREGRKDDRKLLNIFLSQLLSQLTIENVGQETIYFLLDAIDEWGKIYELPRNIEVARARKLSFSLLTNNLNKLSKIYGDDFYTIIGNIDTQMLLGTVLKSDIDYFADLLGLDNEFIKNDLGNDQLLIYEKGLKPILAEKDYWFKRDEWKGVLK